jgi:hypothetical protein
MTLREGGPGVTMYQGAFFCTIKAFGSQANFSSGRACNHSAMRIPQQSLKTMKIIFNQILTIRHLLNLSQPMFASVNKSNIIE